MQTVRHENIVQHHGPAILEVGYWPADWMFRVWPGRSGVWVWPCTLKFPCLHARQPLCQSPLRDQPVCGTRHHSTYICIQSKLNSRLFQQDTWSRHTQLYGGPGCCLLHHEPNNNVHQELLSASPDTCPLAGQLKLPYSAAVHCCFSQAGCPDWSQVYPTFCQVCSNGVLMSMACGRCQIIES